MSHAIFCAASLEYVVKVFESYDAYVQSQINLHYTSLKDLYEASVVNQNNLDLSLKNVSMDDMLGDETLRDIFKLNMETMKEFDVQAQRRLDHAMKHKTILKQASVTTQHTLQTYINVIMQNRGKVSLVTDLVSMTQLLYDGIMLLDKANKESPKDYTTITDKKSLEDLRTKADQLTAQYHEKRKEFDALVVQWEDIKPLILDTEWIKYMDRRKGQIKFTFNQIEFAMLQLRYQPAQRLHALGFT